MARTFYPNQDTTASRVAPLAGLPAEYKTPFKGTGGTLHTNTCGVFGNWPGGHFGRSGQHNQKEERQ